MTVCLSGSGLLGFCGFVCFEFLFSAVIDRFDLLCETGATIVDFGATDAIVLQNLALFSKNAK